MVSPAQPNILRPSTAIIRKLVIASPPTFAPGPAHAAKGKKKASNESAEQDTVLVYGFDRVYPRLALVGDGIEDSNSTSGPGRFLKVILKRLEGTGDLELAAQRYVSLDK
jgi:engulfment/cell motility protein 1